MRCVHSVVTALVLAEPLLISQLGNAFGTSGYYEIRSQTERPSGAPIKMNAAQHAVAAHRRMP
jgi:hypothetical protein